MTRIRRLEDPGPNFSSEGGSWEWYKGYMPKFQLELEDKGYMVYDTTDI